MQLGVIRGVTRPRAGERGRGRAHSTPSMLGHRPVHKVHFLATILLTVHLASTNGVTTTLLEEKVQQWTAR